MSSIEGRGNKHIYMWLKLLFSHSCETQYSWPALHIQPLLDLYAQKPNSVSLCHGISSCLLFVEFLSMWAAPLCLWPDPSIVKVHKEQSLEIWAWQDTKCTCRYYGKSKPYHKHLKEHMQYLTSEQAMADYAELLTFLKKDLGAEKSPVIGFGGSYGIISLFSYIQCGKFARFTPCLSRVCQSAQIQLACLKRLHRVINLKKHISFVEWRT